MLPDVLRTYTDTAEVLRLASDPNAPPAVLEAIWRETLRGDDWGSPADIHRIERALAGNVNLPPPLMLKLANVVPEALAGNPTVPLVALEDPDFMRRIKSMFAGMPGAKRRFEAALQKALAQNEDRNLGLRPLIASLRSTTMPLPDPRRTNLASLAAPGQEEGVKAISGAGKAIVKGLGKAALAVSKKLDLPQTVRSYWKRQKGVRPELEALSFLTGEQLIERLELVSWNEYAALVADAYEAAPVHEPGAVKHWRAMARDTEKLFRRIKSRVNIEFVDYDPYPGHAAVVADIEQNNRLRVMTLYSDHPVFTPEENWMFRAVHDYMAHFQGEHFFDPAGGHRATKGEIASYNRHAKTFSREALPALFTEIIGQACYFHVHGQFPVQKVAVLRGFDYEHLGRVEGHDIQDKRLVRRGP